MSTRAVLSLVARASAIMGAVVILFAGVAAGALIVPPAPSLERPIIDQTDTLSESELISLSEQIAASRTEKDYQLGILMIPTLEGRDIEGYSIEVARAWGIGEGDKDNGVLLLIAKDDRKLRLEIGSGLEGDITDLQSGHIIRDVITPKFKTGDYYGGIHEGIESIHAAVTGAADPHPAPSANVGEGIMNALFQGGIFLIWGGLWLSSILARTKSWWAGGVVGGLLGVLIAALAGWALWAVALLGVLIVSGLGLDWLVSRNYHRRADRGEAPAWWAGGTHLGGGGSGGRFGGGGFSGGGSSGDW